MKIKQYLGYIAVNKTCLEMDRRGKTFQLSTQSENASGVKTSASF